MFNGTLHIRFLVILVRDIYFIQIEKYFRQILYKNVSKQNLPKPSFSRNGLDDEPFWTKNFLFKMIPEKKECRIL